jgi:hypothetical protein
MGEMTDDGGQEAPRGHHDGSEHEPQGERLRHPLGQQVKRCKRRGLRDHGPEAAARPGLAAEEGGERPAAKKQFLAYGRQERHQAPRHPPGLRAHERKQAARERLCLRGDAGPSHREERGGAEHEQP